MCLLCRSGPWSLEPLRSGALLAQARQGTVGETWLSQGAFLCTFSRHSVIPEGMDQQILKMFYFYERGQLLTQYSPKLDPISLQTEGDITR